MQVDGRPPADDLGLAASWALDPGVVFLNHGAFGACPRQVLDEQRAWRDRLEAEPVRFLAQELEELTAAARAALAACVGASPDDLAFVPNATAGVNTVLRSLRFCPADELLATDHGYNASLNALRFAAERDGARVVVAEIPFPIAGPDEAVDAVLACVTPRTRLALLDHVTSPTGLVLPIERLVAELQRRGIDVLVDGAHAPGMVPLDLEALGAAYYTGNCHKWLCAPKGTAFLHVRRDRQADVRPLSISHGANSRRIDRSRFRLEFDWTGTFDPSGFLAIPCAIEHVGGLLEGGWPALMAANRGLALAARDILCAALSVPPPAPDAMVGSMAAVPLPAAGAGAPQPMTPLDDDPLQVALRERFGIQVPIVAWPPAWRHDAPATGGRLIRVSAQAYNRREQYERLGGALRELLAGR